MLRLSLRSLAAKKLRLLATALAIVLGVGFTVGTLVLTDTMDRSFGAAIADITAGVDAVVRGEQVVDPGAGSPSERAPLDDGLVATVAGVDGVAAAAPYQQGYAEVVGADGKVIDATQSVGLRWIPDPELSMFELTAGRAPSAPGEVVLGGVAAEAAGAVVGDDVTVVTAAGPEAFRLVGTAELAGGSDLGGTAFVLLDEGAASGRLGPDGTVDEVLARAEPGVAEAELTARIARASAGVEVEVLSGTDHRAEETADLEGMTGVFRTVLLVFAGIALLVGSFTIANTFTITVAQRTRELALLRAVGGSRRQLVGLVLVEAVVLGAVASAVGVVGGIATAEGLLALLAGIGLEVPGGDLVVQGGTVAAGMATGLVTTVLAALASARRAARIAPVAAMREGVQEAPSATRRRALVGAVLAVVGGLGLAVGVASSSTPLVGVGSLAAVAAVLVAGPVLVVPVLAVLAWPLRRAGVSGRLAAANAVRNPRRSAATAAALTIGVLLVAGASMFAATAKATLGDDLDRTFVADRVVRPSGMGTGLPTSVAAAVSSVEGATAVPMRDVTALVDGSVQAVSGVDLAGAGPVLHLEVVEGGLGGAGRAAVSAGLAEVRGWSLGDAVEVRFASGAVTEVEVAATFEAVTAVPEVLLPYEVVADGAIEALDSRVLVAGPAPALDGVVRALEAVPTAIVETVPEHAASQAGMLDVVLSVVLGFLGLAVVIAVLGIGTTIALSVRERTRELGVLRSIGMSRTQVRRAIRSEAIALAALGATLGAVLGLGCTWALLRTLGDEGFAAPVMPVGSLVAVAVGAVAAGVVAAAVPARRASRLAILEAVRTD